VNLNVQLRIGLAVLAVLHLTLLFPGFVAPYDPTEQDRAMSFASPTAVHLRDQNGSWHMRPFIYAVAANQDGSYTEDTRQKYFFRAFPSGAPYRLFGLFNCTVHLFGVDGRRAMLMGTDRYGRDQFSRLIYGGQVSLFAGLLAALLSLFLGAFVGTVSGFYGRWIDDGLMRLGELFLALPWLYLLFAVRAFLPLSVPPASTFFLVVLIIGLVGWVRPARLVRGVVLSAKEQKYVLAARGFGASDLYLLRRHIMPHTYSVLLTQATLLVPQFVLAEVTLSFLGLGVAEPIPSWGNMLSSLQQYHVMISYWWMFLPGIALGVLFLNYFTVADALQTKVQSAST
jgi:peptide/nickel transport system permease protein